MGVLVQIRNVPEAAHRKLKARAALHGRTLSDYVRGELVAMAERPDPDEVWARIAARPTAHLSEPPAETLRRERDARG